MNSDIDDIFKEGIGGMEFSRQEEIWEHMEKQLDREHRPAGKKRLAYLILLLFFIAGAAFLAVNLTDTSTIHSDTKPASRPAVSGETTPQNDLYSQKVTSLAGENGKLNVITGSEVTSPAQNELKPDHLGKTAKQMIILKGKKRMNFTQAAADMEEDEKEEDVTIRQKRDVFFEMANYAGAANIKKDITSTDFFQVEQYPKKIDPVKRRKNISVGAVAGSDVFNLSKGAGYFAGLKLSKNVGKGVAMSVGINYSSSHLSESYRLINKPSQQQEADAEISRMTMLRFPIMIEQQIGKSKFTAVAGLVPVYILDASIYNLPPVDSASMVNFRKFEINDIKRLNVLFSAGIRYNISRRLGVDITGCYGLTEMVKNSYINQSSINGNFKNLQVGLTYKIN